MWLCVCLACSSTIDSLLKCKPTFSLNMLKCTTQEIFHPNYDVRRIINCLWMILQNKLLYTNRLFTLHILILKWGLLRLKCSLFHSRDFQRHTSHPSHFKESFIRNRLVGESYITNLSVGPKTSQIWTHHFCLVVHTFFLELYRNER